MSLLCQMALLSTTTTTTTTTTAAAAAATTTTPTPTATTTSTNSTAFAAIACCYKHVSKRTRAWRDAKKVIPERDRLTVSSARAHESRQAHSLDPPPLSFLMCAFH